MLALISGSSDVSTQADVLRSYIRRHGIGCNGVKLRFADSAAQHHGTHIRRSALPLEILAELDSGMYNIGNELQLVNNFSSIL